MAVDRTDSPTDVFMETYSGRKFHVLSPSPSDIDIHDIARGLAMQCRFGGHVHQFYSVAEHSVRVSQILPKSMALAGLLHDASEAYIGDMIRPLKQTAELGNQYHLIEDRLMACIAAKFKFEWPLPQAVKEADNILLFTEKRDIKKSKLIWMAEERFQPLAEPIVPWSPEFAEEQFLFEFGYLMGMQI